MSAERRTMMRKLIRGMSLGIALSSVAACTQTIPDCKELTPVTPPSPEFVLVEYVLGDEATEAPDLAVRDTPKLRDARPHIKAVVLRAPDSCLEDLGAGLGDATKSAVRPECAPWITEMESSLSGAGYRVFSWSALLQIEKEQHLTTYDAAKRLGADVVFVFARLDVSQGGAFSGGTKTLRYFAADEHGQAYGPRALDKGTRAEIDSAISQIGFQMDRGPTQLSSHVEGTALSPDTGEAIWFYHRVATANITTPVGIRILFGRYPNQPWKAVVPDVPLEARSHSLAPPDDGPVATKKDHNDGAARAQLIRDAANEFVNAFGGAPQ
jgi:hypothetical protein